MIIEKNNKTYTVKELKTMWSVKSKKSWDFIDFAVEFKIPKESCGTYDEIKEYILTNDVF